MSLGGPRNEPRRPDPGPGHLSVRSSVLPAAERRHLRSPARERWVLSDTSFQPRSGDIRLSRMTTSVSMSGIGDVIRYVETPGGTPSPGELSGRGASLPRRTRHGSRRTLHVGMMSPLRGSRLGSASPTQPSRAGLRRFRRSAASAAGIDDLLRPTKRTTKA